MPSWEGFDVVELGCGTGKLSNMIALLGGNVYGVDYSKKAIERAKTQGVDNTRFEVKDLHDVEGEFDVVVMQGVLEHIDDPFQTLADITKLLKEGGTIITSSPNWLNPRGYVWMTVYYMIQVHMAVVDINFIYPWDMAKWCKRNRFNAEIKSCDQDWGAGKKTLIDYDNRLRSDAINDNLKHKTNVNGLLMFMGHAMGYFTKNRFSGATLVYKLTGG